MSEATNDPRIPGLLDWARGEVGVPYTLDISPTDLCNLRCRSCWMRDPLYGEEFSSDYQLSDERLLSLVDEAASLGVRHIEITGGGEPLVRKKVVLEMMERIKERGMRGSITTNGTLFTKDDVERIVEMGWDHITFSIDGPDANTNDWLRPLKGGESGFERISSALKSFQKAKADAGKDAPEIAFNVVLSRKNWGRMEEMVELAADRGVSAVNVEPLTIHSELGKELRLSEEETRGMQDEVRAAHALAQVRGVHTNISRYAEDNLVTKKNAMPEVYVEDVEEMEDVEEQQGFLSIPCYEPWYHLVVKTDGSVGPCCVFEEKAVNVKEQSLAEIWQGTFLRNVRRSLESQNYLEWCAVCNAGQVLQNRSLRDQLRMRWGGDARG